MNKGHYIPATALFPTKKARWVNDQCRAGRVPGVVKFGRSWMVWVSESGVPPPAPVEPAAPAEPEIPTMEQALEDLRRRGIL